MVTYAQFITLYAETCHDNRDQRLGQYAFNLLLEHHPVLANHLRGSFTHDPFYNDENLSRFWEFTRIHWED